MKLSVEGSLEGPWRRDAPIFAALAVLSIALVPAWADFPTATDPALFVSALRYWDVSALSPHAPGYPLFVLAGRAASIMVGEFHAYQLVNTLLLFGASSMLYVLLAAAGQRTVGAAAAFLLATHPLVLVSAATMKSYFADAFFAIAVALYCSRAKLARTAPFLIGLALLMLLLSLVRPVSCAMLGPLAAAIVFFRSPEAPWLRGALAAGASAGGMAAGWLLTAWLAGGIAAYGHAAEGVMGVNFRRWSVLGGAPLSMHRTMIWNMTKVLVFVSAPLALVTAAALLRRGPGFLRKVKPAAWWLGAAWVLPALLFYLVVFYLFPDYLLVFLPCILIATAYAIHAGLAAGRASGWAVTAALCAMQLGFFWQPWLPGEGKPISGVWNLTRNELLAQVAEWSRLQDAIAAHCDDKTALVYVQNREIRFYALRVMDVPCRVMTTVEKGYLAKVRRPGHPEDGAGLPERIDVIPASIERLAVIDDSVAGQVMRVIALREGASRQVAQLMQPAPP